MYRRLYIPTKKWGYWGTESDWEISPRFAFAGDFKFGYAHVEHEPGVYSLINREGDEVEVIGLGKRFKCHENFFGFRDDQGYRYTTSDPQRRFALVAPLIDGKRVWGIIDHLLIYRPIPDGVWRKAKSISNVFSDNVIIEYASGSNSRYGAYSICDDTFVIPPVHRFIWSSPDDYWLVRTARADDGVNSLQDDCVFFFDIRSRKVSGPPYCNAGPFREGCAFARDEQHSLLLIGSPRQYKEIPFSEVGDFAGGLAYAYDESGNDVCGYIDRTGTWKFTLESFCGELQTFDPMGRAIGIRNNSEQTNILFDDSGSIVMERPVITWRGGDYPYYLVRLDYQGNDEHLDTELNLLF